MKDLKISYKIVEHIDKRDEHKKEVEKHFEEICKLENALQVGEKLKHDLVESMKYLNEANSPNTVQNRITVVKQRKQSLLG